MRNLFIVLLTLSLQAFAAVTPSDIAVVGYPRGISTSVKQDQQTAILNTIAGNTGAFPDVRPLTSADVVSTTPLDGSGVDALSRMRVSDPETIFESTFRWSKQTELWSELLATGGTSTQVGNTASVDLAVTTASGSSATYQTKRYFTQPVGKSNQVFLTSIVGSGQTNTRKRLGYFDANDGIFFELNATTLNVCQRSATSGSPVDTCVAQASWNLDKLNGTGTSAITIDVTKGNTFVLDFGRTGVGRVRLGVLLNGKIIYAHQFLNGNTLTVSSMRQTTLPIRAEITNTGLAASTATLKLIATSIIGEGQPNRVGVQKSASRGFTLRSVTTSFTPLISLRLKSANLSAVMRLLKASVFGTTADLLNVAILVNPTLTGAAFASAGTLSEVDIAATSLTGGTELLSTYLNAAGTSPSVDNILLPDALNMWLGSDLAGVADIFTVAARASAGTADLAASIDWLEFP